MTQFIDPTEPQPFEMDYQSVNNQGNPELLVRLAGIFTIITASFDIIVAIFAVIYAIMVPFIPDAAFTTTGPAAATLPFNPKPMILGIAIVAAVIAGAAGAVKLTGGIKLLRRSRNAWGWGLASGIIGCVALWCSYGCFIPMAAGIFTIVVLSKKSVRTFLLSPGNAPRGSFPIQPPSPPPGSYP